MTAATPEQQRLLLDLQGTDSAIRQLERRRANLPEQQALEEHEDTRSRVGAELADAREQLAATEKRQRRLEEEIATIDTRRKSEEGRMYSGLITSEKELAAIRAELASLKSRKLDLEDELLDAMERREELDGLLATLRERQDELDGQVGELAAARDQAATGIDAELAGLGARRDEQAGGVPDPLLTVYEPMRRRKDGVAVAALEGRTCTGCHLELTAIELEQVKEDAKAELAYCEHCERILVPSG